VTQIGLIWTAQTMRAGRLAAAQNGWYFSTGRELGEYAS